MRKRCLNGIERTIDDREIARMVTDKAGLLRRG